MDKFCRVVGGHDYGYCGIAHYLTSINFFEAAKLVDIRFILNSRNSMLQTKLIHQLTQLIQ
jgi:hypothetical protein